MPRETALRPDTDDFAAIRRTIVIIFGEYDLDDRLPRLFIILFVDWRKLSGMLCLFPPMSVFFVSSPAHICMLTYQSDAMRGDDIGAWERERIFTRLKSSCAYMAFFLLSRKRHLYQYIRSGLLHGAHPQRDLGQVMENETFNR